MDEGETMDEEDDPPQRKRWYVCDAVHVLACVDVFGHLMVQSSVNSLVSECLRTCLSPISTPSPRYGVRARTISTACGILVLTSASIRIWRKNSERTITVAWDGIYSSLPRLVL